VRKALGGAKIYTYGLGQLVLRVKIDNDDSLDIGSEGEV
jgi:hypothetical protein